LVLRNAQLKDATNGSSFRQMKCLAYNALIGIIKKIQKEEKFYNLLFMESDRTGYIWKHLVDHRREMKLSMVPEEVFLFFNFPLFITLLNTQKLSKCRVQ